MLTANAYINLVMLPCYCCYLLLHRSRPFKMASKLLLALAMLLTVALAMAVDAEVTAHGKSKYSKAPAYNPEGKPNSQALSAEQHC